MKLIIVRHGHTDALATSTVQGQGNNGLNKLGHKQARHLAQRLKNEPFDVVYCSDLRRTKETMAALLKHRPELVVIYDPMVRERTSGTYEGRPLEEYLKARKASGEPKDMWRPEGGESFQDLFERAKKWWEIIKQRHSEETVLLISHGGFIRSLLTYIFHGDDFQMRLEYDQDNAGVTVIDLANPSRPAIITLNDTKHLNNSTADTDKVN